MFPSLGLFRVQIIFINVVLPAPLTPNNILTTQLDSTVENKRIEKTEFEPSIEKEKTRWEKIKSALF